MYSVVHAWVCKSDKCLTRCSYYTIYSDMLMVSIQRVSRSSVAPGTLTNMEA